MLVSVDEGMREVGRATLIDDVAEGSGAGGGEGQSGAALRSGEVAAGGDMGGELSCGCGFAYKCRGHRT